MSPIKAVLAIFLATICFGAMSNTGVSDMSDKKVLVLRYDYSPKTIMEKSTTPLHENFSSAYHGTGEFDVEILGEKEKIVLPNIKESFLSFDGNFLSSDLYLEPAGHWYPLTLAKEKIKELCSKFEIIKNISLENTEVNADELTEEIFAAITNKAVGIYKLEKYNVFVILKKIDTPKEIHPREKEYFQLFVRVDTKIN